MQHHDGQATAPPPPVRWLYWSVVSGSVGLVPLVVADGNGLVGDGTGELTWGASLGAPRGRTVVIRPGQVVFGRRVAYRPAVPYPPVRMACIKRTSGSTNKG